MYVFLVTKEKLKWTYECIDKLRRHDKYDVDQARAWAIELHGVENKRQRHLDEDQQQLDDANSKRPQGERYTFPELLAEKQERNLARREANRVTHFWHPESIFISIDGSQSCVDNVEELVNNMDDSDTFIKEVLEYILYDVNYK